jgi:hypothetical protein
MVCLEALGFVIQPLRDAEQLSYVHDSAIPSHLEAGYP